jgi:histone H3/H4
MWNDLTFFGKTWFWASFALVTLGGLFSVAWAGGSSSVELIKAIAWPVAVVAIVALFAFHPRLNRLFGLAKIVKKISAGGIQMEISADAVDAVRKQLRLSISELIENAEDEYRRMAEAMRIYELLERVVIEAFKRILENNGLAFVRDIRATIHVQDIVFREYLYQIVDYYPPSGAAGRRFPQRYGMIGRSWRLGESLGEGDAFEGGKGEERALIMEWGMVRQEVNANSRNRSAYLAIILREDNGVPVGVVFADSGTAGAFGDDSKATKVAIELEKTSEVAALSKAVERALTPLRLAGPNLDIRNAIK